jgi:hypothetical protein
MDNNNKIEVIFTHPTNRSTFTAFINPQCTGQKAIHGLLMGNRNGPFLNAPPPGQAYKLAKKSDGQEITPSMTFEEAGVGNGDVVEVMPPLTGAS